MKENQSAMELLSQMKESENTYAQSKIDYNTGDAPYNTLIHSFSNNLLRRIFRFADAEFYNESQETIITDDELGI